ncbi:MAG: nucleotidyltransferase family protein [bacterium]
MKAIENISETGKTADKVFYKKDYNIARNIIAQKQFNVIADAFNKSNIDFIPLKGIVYINLIYENIWDRFLTDIDLLIKTADLSKIHNIMNKLGYTHLSSNPLGWTPVESGLNVDLHTDIWYLSKHEIKELWQSCAIAKFCGFSLKLPSKEEMIIYAIAHSLIHHANKEGNLRDDLINMFTKWQNDIDLLLLINKIKKYNFISPFVYSFNLIRSEIPYVLSQQIEAFIYPERNIEREKEFLIYLNLKHPLKGHLLRLIFQRNIYYKIAYILSTLFPQPYIMRWRYNAHSSLGICLTYAARPFLLAYYSLKVLFRLSSRKSSVY